MRYEDLILDWTTKSKELSAFLDIEIPSETKTVVDKTFSKHARSASPEKSIGRWRTDLSTEDRRSIEASCTDFMERFGYFDRPAAV
jgi:hypothetical protein